MLASWVTYYMTPGTREAFCRICDTSGIYEKCQHDADRYEFLLPYGGSDRIQIIERWKDDEQLWAHCNSEHVKALQPMKKGYVVANECVGVHVDSLFSIDTD